MEGDSAASEAKAAHAWDLQPPGGPRVDLAAPVPDNFEGMSSQQKRRTLRLQEGIDRRMADRQLVELLRRDGFKGRNYDRFIEELVRYGVSVLRAWMHSGYVFQVVAARGYGLKPHELDLEELASDSDLREELATMTVALALPRFRQRALLEHGWTHEGGASITTYFMGACVYDFPNEFRRCKSSRMREHRLMRRKGELAGPEASHLGVPEEVLGNLWVMNRLDGIADGRTKMAVALTVEGYSQSEICELLDMGSERAVEGAIYRWRRAEKGKAAKEGEGNVRS
ncbi:hypothetical protein DY245_14910 [Streptomyces inhibens]|uniref:Uncharacterized protein n=1 Tax=Streptomyces inhibens TaxID=2293571 RepID=A0A371Q4N4_STRIH|nr:hypothetical protein [Streptomyces inhibens]REK89622.1 hypothetical protein DY245_14910 [Streptomyces inhibens]